MIDSNPDSDRAQLKHSTELGNIKLYLEFTGDGSVYFRIWITSLLRMVVTLGLYYPWAKVRSLRYFYGHTLVDGDPLDFHGDPKKMANGYLLVGLMAGLFFLAAGLSVASRFVALLVIVALWPVLLQLFLQFRLANTSWRGLHFRFKGSLRGAYRAAVPLLIPGVLLFELLLTAPNTAHPPSWVARAALAVVLCTLAALPYLLWNLKRYQNNHYALGYLQTHLRATPASFYRLFFRIIGFTVLTIVVPTALIGYAIYGAQLTTIGAQYSSHAATTVASTLAVIVVVFIAVRPYAIARLQNMVWTQTGNRSMRFISVLRFRALLWLTAKNSLLIVLTLGLYWPFAAVAMARMRVGAIRIKTRIDPNTLVGSVRASEGDGANPTVDNFLGVNIGL